MTLSENALEVNRLKVVIAGKTILRDVSFVLKKGDFMALVGPNGAGKSTLVKTILGLVPLQQGQIKLFGEGQNGSLYFEKIGYLPQKNLHINYLMPATGEEIVFTGMRRKVFGFDKKTQRNKLNQAFKSLAICHLRKRIFNQLSGGEQQKILLARALVDEPQFLILDEPTVSLDEENKTTFLKIVKDLNQEKRTTILFITHSLVEINECINKIFYIDKKIIERSEIRDLDPFSSLTLKSNGIY